MKVLHRPDLYAWSRFDEARSIDFHGYAWARSGGTVLFDPLPMSQAETTRLDALGPVAWIVVSNSDHRRAAAETSARTGAKIAGPRAERETLGLDCARWLGEGDELVPGLRTIELDGSKTPGELAFVLEDTTLICGDLVRAHAGGALTMLPDAKLGDRARAMASVRRLVALTAIDAVLVGDGWPVFREGQARLRELEARLG